MSRCIIFKVQKQQINLINCNMKDEWRDTCITRLGDYVGVEGERPPEPTLENMIYINWYEGGNLKGDWFKYNTNTIDGSIFDDFGKENIFLITIDDGFTEIASSAFQNCTRLAYLTIPNSVTSIGDKAFNNVPTNGTLYCNKQWFDDLPDMIKNNLGNVANWNKVWI